MQVGLWMMSSVVPFFLGVNKNFSVFAYIHLKIVIGARLCKVGNVVLIGQKIIIVFEECKYGGVIRVCEVCCDRLETYTVVVVEGKE